MRLLNSSLVLGMVAMLGVAAPAYADEVRVEADDTPHSTLSVVAKDGLYGGLAGAAVGGGILLIQNDGFDARTFGLATGIGLLAGVGLGFIDAAAQHPGSTALMVPENTDRQARPEGTAKMADNTGLPKPWLSFQKSGQF